MPPALAAPHSKYNTIHSMSLTRYNFFSIKKDDIFWLVAY